MDDKIRFSHKPPPLPYPVPEPIAIADLVMADGAVIRLRRHGNADGPRIVMSHGNGMAINAYAQFWGPLCDRYDIVLFDFRNHGANPVQVWENHRYKNFVADMTAVRRGISANFGDKPTAGAFHSLSAITCALHGLTHGKIWDAVVMFDPPFHPPKDHPDEPAFDALMWNIAARARRRPERYPTADTFAGQLKRNRNYAHWAAGAHELFAHATLRPDPARGDYVLACPRELESNVFIENATLGLWSRMKDFPRPVLFICGDPEAEFAMAETTVSGLMARDAGIELAIVPGTDHLLQLEKPEEAAALMCDFLARRGFKP